MELRISQLRGYNYERGKYKWRALKFVDDLADV